MSKELFEYQKELDSLTRPGGWLHQVSTEFADIKQVKELFKSKRDQIIAKVANDIMLRNNLSVSKSELKAKASKEFSEFIEAMEISFNLYFKLEAKKETLLNRADALRTFISLEKEKMSMR